MALLARFIGINKHLSKQIPDLGGAVRDATALWSLFKDTFSTIDAELIIDEKATASYVRQALLDTLLKATENDDIILSFAGHGTPDHRIVAHDTQVNQIEDTTISMAELADSFRKTQAKTVICILDCCFSGAAPARVLEGIPSSRSLPFNAASITGKGRVLITASGLDEPAYEHPVYRHGLLTYAVIKSLLNSTGEVPLLAIMQQVLEQVRSDISSLGRKQTPFAFNLTEGDLRISALKPGPLFHLHFPDRVGIRIGKEIHELASFGLPDSVLSVWGANFSGGLNELQMKVVNEYRILEGESALVVAPTSSGKTFVGELAAIKAITEGRKAVFLLPYRALVNEKYDTFSDLYGDRLNMRVIRCSGDYLDDTSSFILGKYDIALLTYEMFLSLAITNTPTLSRIGLVVLDEAQFITDKNRGITVELILTCLKIVKYSGIQPQLIALSATIGALNKFDQWLGIRSFITDSRPVPLEMGVIDRTGIYEFLDEAGDQKTIQLLPASSIYVRRSEPSSQDVIIPLVKHLMSDQEKKEKIIVFRNRKGPAEGCAEYLARELILPAAEDVIEALPINDPSSTSGRLRSALQGGTAVHNANLTRDERVLVERSFRDPEGKIRVLVATTTVAAGINTPASTVILVEHSFPWEDKDFTVAEIKNMAGRAGRLGFREVGRAIMLADTPFERQQLFQKYVLGKPEEICSSFETGNVGTWLLRLLSQVQKVKTEDLILLVINTYGGFLETLKDPDWQLRTQNYLSQLLPRMKTAGLLDEENGEVRLTLLGKVCGESSLSFESTLRFIQMLKEANSSSSLHLMTLIQALPELDGQYTPLFKRGQKEAVWPGELARALGQPMSQVLQKWAADLWMYYARTKRACILLDWVEGKSIGDIEKRFSTNLFNPVGAGDIRGLADTTRFHLRSAFNIASVLLPGSYPDPSEIEKLLKQLEFGIPAYILPLLSPPLRFTRGELLALSATGIATIEDFWNLPSDKLTEIFSFSRVKQIEVYKPKSI